MRGLQRFLDAWCHPEYPPTKVSEADIAVLEAELGIGFPQDYRQSIIEVGAPSPTTRLWDWLLDEDDRLGYRSGPVRHHLTEFHTPDQIRESLGWRNAGMPDDLIPFISDSGGNKICFRTDDLSPGNAAQAKVYFWNHDFLETELDGPSFDEWLKTYLPNE